MISSFYCVDVVNSRLRTQGNDFILVFPYYTRLAMLADLLDLAFLCYSFKSYFQFF